MVNGWWLLVNGQWSMVVTITFETSYLSNILHQHILKNWKFTPKKRVNRDILNIKYYIFGIFINLIVIVSQFSYIYINMLTYQSDFYPSDNNFTQALLVMLLTNVISGSTSGLQMVY